MNWITNSVLPKIKALVQSNDVPDNLWVKCPSCNQMLFHQEYEQAFHCCTTCGYHAPLPPELRFKLLFDSARKKAWASLQDREDVQMIQAESKKARQRQVQMNLESLNPDLSGINKINR